MESTDVASPSHSTQIAALGPWFHNLHLPGGAQTAPQHPLGDFPSYKWAEIGPHLPGDLSGWNVLDIGCNAGFYSFALAHRGAQVLGVDIDPHYLNQARWAAREFGLEQSVEFRQMAVYDLASLEGTFDLVLFMGVFYHLRYPLLGLDIVARKVKRLLVFQTLTMPGEEAPEVPATSANLQEGLESVNERDTFVHPTWPKMAFIEGQFAGDPTNWWAANPAGVEAMLRSTGMSIKARPGHEIYLCEPDPQAELWFLNETATATPQAQHLTPSLK
jgi:tRNA (mo5U34)-methyltransferase